MEPKYVLILDFFVGCLNIIKLTDEELRESEEYEDFEDFLLTIEEKYGFRLNSCQWMVTEKSGHPLLSERGRDRTQSVIAK